VPLGILGRDERGREMEKERVEGRERSIAKDRVSDTQAERRKSLLMAVAAARHLATCPPPPPPHHRRTADMTPHRSIRRSVT